MALVISGNPPMEELQKAEHLLRLQYADAVGNYEYIMYANVMKEVTRLEVTLAQIEELIKILRKAYHQNLVNDLSQLLNYKVVLDVMKPEEYDNALDRALRRSKGIKLAIDFKKMELAGIEKKFESGNHASASREHYLGVLIALSNDAKYPVTELITVWEYCERLRIYNKKAELSKPKNTKKNG